MQALQYGIYNDPTSQTFNIDATWDGLFNYCQPGPNVVFTFNLPTIAWVIANCPNGLHFWIKNNSPSARVLLQLPGYFAGPGTTNWVGDTINGNTDKWYIAGDESIEIFADTSYPASDWKTVGTKPGIRQWRWAPPLNVAAIMPPSASFVDVPGVSAWLEQWLQSGSSREKVRFDMTVASSLAADVAYFTISDTVKGNLHLPGNKGINALTLVSQNHPYTHSVCFERAGGYLYNDGYSLAPNLYKLRAYSSGTLSIGLAGNQFETQCHVEEFSVD